MARLLELPRRAVVPAEDETHLNLLPHVRANWTLRGARPEVFPQAPAIAVITRPGRKPRLSPPPARRC